MKLKLIDGKLTKLCPNCNLVKGVECFTKHPTNASGLQSWCRSCAGAKRELKRKRPSELWRKTSNITVVPLTWHIETLHIVREIVCREYNVTVMDFQFSRRMEPVIARNVFCYIGYEYMDSLQATIIANFLGKIEASVVGRGWSMTKDWFEMDYLSYDKFLEVLLLIIKARGKWQSSHLLAMPVLEKTQLLT